MTYLAPLDHMKFVIDHLCNYSTISSFPAYEDATSDTVHAILEEAARFASSKLASINRHGDIVGCSWCDGVVRTSKEWRNAYLELIENGWNSPTADHQYAGMGLPNVVNAAVQEMFHGANMAFQLCPMLTQGAIEALEHYGSGRLKEQYLPKLVTGEWSGTMNLTESQAGSDLSAIRTIAVPDGDHYLVRGQKIFITYGEHDLSENIIHLVLARLPNAPVGVKGISMFVVPKFILDEDGSPNLANDISCVSIEHKLGIHGSPTCTMAFGENNGAVGYLVGQENQGLQYMFTMMNNARLSVGLQGIGVGDHAYQNANVYAAERVQGGKPIAEHADVARMLGHMRAMTEAGRILAYRTAAAQDMIKHSTDPDTKSYFERRVGLLIPIVKGFWCEQSVKIASTSVQIHGGMGYIEETGVAQHLRDTRVTTLYEGTTGIQALDLVSRKIIRDNGSAALELIEEIRSNIAIIEDSADIAIRPYAGVLKEVALILEQCVGRCLKTPEIATNRAHNVLYLFGCSAAIWGLVEAHAAKDACGVGENSPISDSANIARIEFLPHAKAELETLMAAIDLC